MFTMERWSKADLQKASETDHLQHAPQRSREWHAARSFRLTASDAPLVCGELRHISAEMQREEVLQRKLGIVRALNRGEAIPVHGTPQQQTAMAWGTAHESDGALAYANAAALSLLDPARLCSREGLQVPVADATSSGIRLLCDVLLPECGIRVRPETARGLLVDMLLPS